MILCAEAAGTLTSLPVMVLPGCLAAGKPRPFAWSTHRAGIRSWAIVAGNSSSSGLVSTRGDSMSDSKWPCGATTSGVPDRPYRCPLTDAAPFPSGNVMPE